jgi:hypothetical protein
VRRQPNTHVGVRRGAELVVLWLRWLRGSSALGSWVRCAGLCFASSRMGREEDRGRKARMPEPLAGYAGA